jgi:hypothetical protein
VYEDEKGGVKLFTHEGAAKRIPAVLFKDSVWQVRLRWPTFCQLCSPSSAAGSTQTKTRNAPSHRHVTNQDSAVVALDAFYHIYVWVGSKASDNLKLIAPKLVSVIGLDLVPLLCCAGFLTTLQTILSRCAGDFGVVG